MLYHTWLISRASPRTHTHADVGAVFYLKSSHDLHWHSQKFSCYQLVLKNSSKKLNQLWFVAWGRKCFTKVIFSKAVSKRYCKHDCYSCPCCWCFKQTQAEEAESVRKEREISREDGKGGKSKNVGTCHGLALLSGRCTFEATAKGQSGTRAGVWHRWGGSSAAESPLAFLKYTGCYLQKAQSKTWF